MILAVVYVVSVVSSQPDLLNFKKGWMVKLDGPEQVNHFLTQNFCSLNLLYWLSSASFQWKKYWFVLSADSLRFYKDSIAEEVFSFCFNRIKIQSVSFKVMRSFFCPQASDLEGEIDLTKCYSVSEYQVQRNYGFQIHVRSWTQHTETAVSSAPTRRLTRCFYASDAERCLHAVGHDVWDTQELDPGSDEERTSGPRPWCDQVKSHLQNQKWPQRASVAGLIFRLFELLLFFYWFAPNTNWNIHLVLFHIRKNRNLHVSTLLLQLVISIIDYLFWWLTVFSIKY